MKYKLLLKELRQLTKQYNCRISVKWNTRLYLGGYYITDLNTIFLNKNSFGSKDILVSTVFHELQHHIDYTLTGKWKKHYKLAGKDPFALSKKDRKYFNRYIWNLENYTDRMAHEHKKRVYPNNFKYIKGYRTKSSKKWLESIVNYED